MNIYQNILSAKKESKKLVAVLIDPEKMDLKNITRFLKKVHNSIATHIFVGGSTDINNETENLVLAVKKETNLPIVLFPESKLKNKIPSALFVICETSPGNNTTGKLVSFFTVKTKFSVSLLISVLPPTKICVAIELCTFFKKRVIFFRSIFSGSIKTATSFFLSFFADKISIMKQKI